jgi:predicted acetyltransferase
VRDHELAMHPIDLGNIKPLVALANERARRTNGNLDRSAGVWDRVVSAVGAEVHAYLIGERGAPEGSVVFTQHADKPGPYNLYVRDMVALTGRAARRLWTFFSDHRSYSRTVSWAGPAQEPLLLDTSEQTADVEWRLRWLLRIVDVEKALAQRGYPSGLDTELHLEITDDVLEANSGRYVLHVNGAEAGVERGGRGDLRTDVRGLAPLFTGLHDPLTLRTAGRIAADDATVATAARIFAGPEPWFPDMF